MIKLLLSAQAWGGADFPLTLTNEIERLPHGTLPLDHALTQGGIVDPSRVTATLLSAIDDGQAVQAKVGIFFTALVICCGCGDDPMAQHAYGELRVCIDKTTGEAQFAVISD
jgi:hypothetical protein